MNRGLLYAFGTYGLWGLLPIYWKFLDDVPALEILGHRMVWSLLVVVVILTYKKRWQWLKPALHQPQILLAAFIGALLVTFNWFIFIWAVNVGFIVEASLGYFINPLVSVVLGVIIFSERLRVWQWLAVGLAASGVLYLTVSYATLPWIALSLAITFAIYGVFKKKTSLGALEGLSLETALLFLPAMAYLLYLNSRGMATFGHSDLTTTLLLALAGIATATPLLFFAAAARRISLSTLGILQYIAPTGQFLLGVFVYAEPFDHSRLIGFSLIWIALLIYSVEGVVVRRRPPVLHYSNA